jgi:16S rRNA (cytosine967-C5)-methyltransferase
MTAPASHSAPLASLLLHAAEALQGVLAGRSLTEALAQTPDSLRPGAQALAFHVLRHLGEAQALRQALVPRTPPEALLDALLQVALSLLLPRPDDTGSTQAGMPVYSAFTVVDQAVRAASSQPRLRNYKGLVNGALRAFLRDRDALLARVRIDPQARWNHPAWWIDKLRADYPQQWETLLAAADGPAPMILRVNRRRATRAQVEQAFEAAGHATRPLGEWGLLLVHPRPVPQLPGFLQGWWSVQDAGAQLAAPLLGVEDGMRVLDACAAPGGKTAHLLELADIELLALDSDAARLRRVEDNLERLGLMPQAPQAAPRPDRAAPGRVTLRAADAARPDTWWDGKPFDAVLADVPCTASGIVRRHPDIRWLRRPDDLPRTVALQRRILDALWTTVAPGGRLLYVTCSLFPEEGELQARAFAARHPQAQRLAAPGQLLPVAMDATPQPPHDAFFYALFAKPLRNRQE